MEEEKHHVIYRGIGPYPEPCAFCGAAIAGDERYVITDDGAVRHEVCQFFLDEDESGSESGEDPT